VVVIDQIKSNQIKSNQIKSNQIKAVKSSSRDFQLDHLPFAAPLAQK
jgi:hypothetical protein